MASASLFLQSITDDDSNDPAIDSLAASFDDSFKVTANSSAMFVLDLSRLDNTTLPICVAHSKSPYYLSIYYDQQLEWLRVTSHKEDRSMFFNMKDKPNVGRIKVGIEKVFDYAVVNQGQTILLLRAKNDMFLHVYDCAKCEVVNTLHFDMELGVCTDGISKLSSCPIQGYLALANAHKVAVYDERELLGTLIPWSFNDHQRCCAEVRAIAKTLFTIRTLDQNHILGALPPEIIEILLWWIVPRRPQAPFTV